jgi:tetratricopeptide (TPR) repeat protein
MKANETISWMEAYGPVSAEASAVHGKDWASAVAAVEESLEKTCPRALVDDMHQRAKKELDGKAGNIWTVGEGWALVDKELLGERFRDSGLEFPESCLGEREEPWLRLIREGSLPCPGVLEEPGSYQIGREWESLLEESIKAGGSRHWYGYYQYGVVLAHSGRMKEAEKAFDDSLECAVSPWALRNKALLRDLAGDRESAVKLWIQALTMLPEPNIAKETLQILSKAGKYREIIELYNKLPSEVKELGRLKVILIEALLETGDIDGAEDMLQGDIELTDIREGEVKLTDLWFRMTAMKRARETGVEVDDALLKQVQRECTPPLHLDFRMH